MALDEMAKKTALLMIPYGLYVLGTNDDGRLNAATVNFVTQASFKPPLTAVGVKVDSASFDFIKSSRAFSLSILGSGQKDLAFNFFKAVDAEGDRIGGQAFETAETGAPIIKAAPAWVDCKATDIVERGDHAVVVGEVVAAGVREETKILTMDECGVKYGG